MKIYLSVTIDTECDKGTGWRVKHPLSFTNVYDGVVNLLQPLFDKHGIRATYLLSPEVMRDQKSLDIFTQISSKAELGTHLHSEFIEPESNYTAETTNEYQHLLAPEIESQKLLNLTSLFAESFGFAPKSFRAGRFSVGINTLKTLEKLGYTVDGSVTPDIWWQNSVGEYINFMGAPYTPYHPSSKDLRVKGDLKIIEFPVSTINPRLRYVPKSIKKAISLSNRYKHILFNLLTGFYKPLWLRPTYSNLEDMKRLINYYPKRESIFLSIMFHSNEFTPNTSPYSKSEEDVKVFTERLESLLHWLKVEHNCTFIGMSQIADYEID